MISFEDIKINYDNLVKIENEARSNYNFNPACTLIEYWSERMPKKMKTELEISQSLPYGYVGDGWPFKSDQTKVLLIDKRKLNHFYRDFHNRDCGDAVYQANILMDILKVKDKDERYSVIDFGGGYGRLAIPFLYYLNNIRYFSIDSVPLSLLIAPQFVKQIFKKMRPFYVYDYEHRISNLNQPDKAFYSISAWKIDSLKFQQYDLYISVHSFQEMERAAVDFYVQFAHEQTIKFENNKKAYFYSINIDPKDKYVPDSWELIFDRKFPFNRDGSYNEKLWRIK